MPPSKFPTAENRAVCICGFLTGGVLLTALPFVISNAYVAKSPNLEVAPAVCIGAAFLVGMMLIVKGIANLRLAQKEQLAREIEEAASF